MHTKPSRVTVPRASEIDTRSRQRYTRENAIVSCHPQEVVENTDTTWIQVKLQVVACARRAP
jgi:hypothetical protein